MFTQCPHCHAIYRIEAETLAAARGRVQCGECEQAFDALPGLRDELPGTGTGWENTELPFTLPENREVSGPEASQATEPDGPAADREEARDTGDQPETAEPPGWPGPVSRASRLWPVASIVLGAVLAAQLLFLAPRAMAGHEALRPVAGALCRLSGCELPPRIDLDRLRLASRDVRAHPSVPGALIISATLVNEADFSQPYPALEISLGDLRGRQVALRRFEPGAYVPESVNVERGMAPESRVQVSLEVVDPGESAVAFEFAFRRSADR